MVPNAIQPMEAVHAQRVGMVRIVWIAHVQTIALAKSAITHANVTKITREVATRGLENVIVRLAGVATCAIAHAHS